MRRKTDKPEKTDKSETMRHNVLIATRSFGSTSPKPQQMLEAAGCDLIKADMSETPTEDRLIDMLAGIDAAIIGVVPMTADVMAKASRLKIICAHGVGVDHIDLAAASGLGISVANCPGGSAQSVADLTFGLMIAAARNICGVERELRQGGWGRYHGIELWRKTLGIVGLGRIGRAVARRAAGFEMNVLACDPFIDSGRTALPGIKVVVLDELLQQSDLISLHVPLTDETRNMIGTAQFAAMKSGAYLINTARGGLVDEKALYRALADRRLAGAALDVFALEPPGNSPLLGLDNIVLTPHIGAHTREAVERVGIMAADNIIASLEGRQPPYRVT
jgi:D-3-phosphoglycerate dehydrogenase